jgi:glyoxylase-like metal-dependent hydrolase (beta-lactamase superfamily II)
VSPTRTSLLAAVHAALGLDPGVVTTFPGGIWTGEIPEAQATRFPAAVVDQAGGGWEFTGSGGPDLEKPRLAVSAFAASAAELEACLNRLEAFLPGAAYRFDGSDLLVYLLPADRTVRSELVRSPTGDQVFAGDLVFDAAVWRF